MREMFCFQCQQTAHNTGCDGKAGVCGKKADTANYQDELIGALIGLARAAILTHWTAFWAKNGYRVTSLPEHGAKRCSSLPLPLARWWTAAEAKSSESCPLRSVPVV